MFGEMAQMLMDKGLRHEQAVLDRYRADGRAPCSRCPNGPRASRSRAWAARVAGLLLDAEHDVIYQMPFVHDGIRGIADFLERVVDADGNAWLRAGRREAGPQRRQARPRAAAVLLRRGDRRATGSGARAASTSSSAPARARRSGSTTSCRTGVACARQLAALVAEPPTEATAPEPCDHCAFCEFEPVCDAEWRAADSLVHVAGIRRADRALLDDRRRDHDRGSCRAGPRGRRPRCRAVGTAWSARRTCRCRPARHRLDPPPFELLEPRPGRRRPPELDVAPVEPEPDGLRRAARSPTTATCSSTSRATRSGRPTSGLFFLFGLIERDDGRVGLQGVLGARPSRGGPGHRRTSWTTWPSAAAATRTCTCTTTTTPSAPRCGAWPRSTRWPSSSSSS